MGEGISVYVTENCALADSVSRYGDYLLAATFEDLVANVDQQLRPIEKVFLDQSSPIYNRAKAFCRVRNLHHQDVFHNEMDF